MDPIFSHSKLKAAASIINKVPNESLEFILYTLNNKKTKPLFGQSELQNLKAQLKLENEKLQSTIQTVTYISRYLSKFLLKPMDLRSRLVSSLNVQESKADIFVRHWSEEVKNNYDLENRFKLQKVTWQLNIQSSSTYTRKDYAPNVTFQLETSNSSDRSQDIKLNLNKEELENLYCTLETIQMQLDSV